MPNFSILQTQEDVKKLRETLKVENSLHKDAFFNPLCSAVEALCGHVAEIEDSIDGLYAAASMLQEQFLQLEKALKSQKSTKTVKKSSKRSKNARSTETDSE